MSIFVHNYYFLKKILKKEYRELALKINQIHNIFCHFKPHAIKTFTFN